MNTLDHLDEMGIPVVCDCWLRLPANPDIACVDSLYRAAVSAKRLDANALSCASASAKNLPGKGTVHLQNMQEKAAKPIHTVQGVLSAVCSCTLVEFTMI